MSEKLSLVDYSSDSSDSEVELTVNKSYAQSYNQWRNKEELQKYKDLKKDEEDSESSSESEEEIPEFDDEFFRALSLLKGKDPRIYDKNFELFKNKEIVKKPKAVKQKPLYIKDYERNLVLERGGKFSDEDDEDNIPDEVQSSKYLYDEEQENKLKMFKDEAYQSSSDSDGDGDLLQIRTKSKEEEEAEEADHVKWLKGEEKDVSEDVKKDMSHLRNYWNDPKLDEGEKFLKDYILNKRYLEKEDSEVPTYEELTSGRLSDDEKMVEEQEKFEHKYNFRFEEPDEEFIKRYPRTIGDSLRRPDNRRKQKREEIAERKAKEREQRREELKRLKALKRKEIEEKFMKLKEISGHSEINLNESDIESDFDPDKHDQKMGEMFNDDYYQVEENDKPEFPYDEELESENWNAWTGEKIADYEDADESTTITEEKTKESNQNKLNFKEDFANEMISASRPKKQMKKKSLFAKIISQPKPIYDPDGKAFEEYLDEYYKLDYEDVIGDMPVRYKYRKVIPNDFGLSVDEILTADDKELNRWCSVKKTCQYRKDDEELYDVQAFHKKAEIPLIKKKFFPSVYAPKETDDSVMDSNNLNSETEDSENILEKSKEAKGIMGFDESDGNQQAVKHDSATEIHLKKKSKKKKRKENQDTSVTKSGPRSTLSNEDIDTKSKESQNSPVMETEYASLTAAEMTTESDKNKKHSSNFQESSNRKSVKRKKELHEDDSVVDSDSGDDIVKDFSPKSKHKSVSHSNVSPSVNPVSENTTKVPSKKKKKKKNKNKKKKLRVNEASDTAVTQGNKSAPHHSKSQNRHKQHASEDKRLGLSDERLAAYGINPKKFKNRIIYSKK